MDKFEFECMLDMANFLRKMGQDMICQADEIEKRVKISMAKELPDIGNIISLLVEIEFVRKEMLKKGK